MKATRAIIFKEFRIHNNRRWMKVFSIQLKFLYGLKINIYVSEVKVSRLERRGVKASTGEKRKSILLKRDQHLTFNFLKKTSLTYMIIVKTYNNIFQ